jgi:hypothetical protein
VRNADDPSVLKNNVLASPSAFLRRFANHIEVSGCVKRSDAEASTMVKYGFQRGSWRRKVYGEIIHLCIGQVAQYQFLFGGKHAQTVRHVVEGNVEKTILSPDSPNPFIRHRKRTSALIPDQHKSGILKIY